MIEMHLLEQLEAFARNGTLSRAAEELHITQPALTRSMKKIEEETGLVLFNREGRKISLNDGGMIAARYASRILEEERDMERELYRWDQSQRTVSIGSCAPLPLTRIMPALQVQFPDKSLITEIMDHDDTLIAHLKSGDMQAVILHERPQTSGVFAQQYIHENICVFVKKDHPLAKKKSVSLKELSEYNLLISRHIGFWLPLSQKVLPDNLLVQESIDALDELAESSSTPMFNSDAMIKDGYQTGNRIAIPIKDECMHATYYVACQENRKDSLHVLFNSVRAEALKEH